MRRAIPSQPRDVTCRGSRAREEIGCALVAHAPLVEYVYAVEPRAEAHRKRAAGAEHLGMRVLAVRQGSGGEEARKLPIRKLDGGHGVVDVAELA